MLTTIALYAGLAAICFVFPPSTRLRPLVDAGIILFPVLALRFRSRQFEYEADRISAAFTQNPRAAARALENMYQFAHLPASCDSITALFLTHPSLDRRLEALGRLANGAEAVQGNSA